MINHFLLKIILSEKNEDETPILYFTPIFFQMVKKGNECCKK